MLSNKHHNYVTVFCSLLLFLLYPNTIVSSFHILSTSNTKMNRLTSPDYYSCCTSNKCTTTMKLKESPETTTEQKDENIEEPKKSTPVIKQAYNFNVPPLLRPHISPTNNDISQLSPTTLAYIGDVVYELFVRSRYIYPPRTMSEVQYKVVNNVRAETQSKVLQLFTAKFPLLKSEVGVMQRGRNASSKSGPKRFKSLSNNGKNDNKTYQDATAFETLIGYLYIKDLDRCYLALNCVNSILDDMDS